MRLIDADSLFKKLVIVIRKADDGSLTSEPAVLLADIEKAETTIPAPERTGTWSEEYDPNDDLFFRRKYRCSACGDWNTYGFTRFCPACGARMLNASALTKENEQ